MQTVLTAEDRSEPSRRGPHGIRRIRTALTVLGLGSLALLNASPSRSPQVEVRAGRWRARFEEAQFVSGDLIFRRGRSLVSRAVLAVDGGSEYSHVGLISVTDGQVWVLHEMPPEEPDRKGGALAEPLSTFLAPGNATAAGLYRPEDVRAAAIAERAAWRSVRARVPFDSAFDISTSDEMYCTEMVWRAYREAGIDLAPPDPSRKEKYLLPSRLLRSPHLRRIQELTEEGAIQ
ncbi:MAG: YiiX/YebB-like N1pC/P60 family cysteine hydrolase [Thermoanaerobaculia bacterium]